VQHSLLFNKTLRKRISASQTKVNPFRRFSFDFKPSQWNNPPQWTNPPPPQKLPTTQTQLTPHPLPQSQTKDISPPYPRGSTKTSASAAASTAHRTRARATKPPAHVGPPRLALCLPKRPPRTAPRSPTHARFSANTSARNATWTTK